MLSDYTQTLIDSIGVPTLIIDTGSFKIMFANRAAKDLVGGKDPVSESLSCCHIFPEKKNLCDQTACLIRQVILTKAPVRTMRDCHEAGVEFFYDIVVTPIFSKNGEIPQVTITICDITGIKRTEESSELFRYLIDKSNDGVLIIDPQTGCFLDVNRKICSDLGYTREELLNMGILDIQIKKPDDRSFDKLVNEARNSRYMLVEASYCRKNHSIMPVEVSLRFLTHEKKEYIVCIVRDISRRKKAENILHERKKFAASLVRYSTVPTFVIDSKHSVLHWNQACEELTGIDASDILGTERFYLSDNPSLADVVVSRELGEQIKRDKKYVRSTYVSSGLHSENWVSNLGGKKRYVLFDASPIYNSKNELVAALETMQDITEQKHAEQLVKHRLEMEEAIASVSTLFIAPTDIDGAIDAALDKIGRLCGASRSYIFMFCEDRNFMTNTHEWSNEGVEPQKEKLQFLPTDRYPWWMAKLHNEEIIDINDVSSLPPEASAEKKILEMQDIKSLLVLPIYSTGKLMGYIGLDNVMNTGGWSEDNINVLQIVSGVIGMAINRKRSEEAHRESEERFRGLFENIPVPILEEDFSDVKTYIKNLIRKEHIDDLKAYLVQHPDVVSSCAKLMKILDVNQATLELYGAGSKSELLENMEKTFTRESYVTFSKELVAILNGEIQMETDGVIQTLSGMTREIEVYWSVSPGHEDTLSRVLVSFIDITERKRAEEEFFSAHQKLMDIIDFLPDATFVLDSEQKVIAWNHTLEEMTGIKKEDILGKNDYAYAFPFYGKRRKMLIDLLFDPEIKHESEYDIFEKERNLIYAEAFVPRIYNGKGAYLWLIASPLLDSNGNQIGAIESIRDITDRKQAGDNLRKYAEELQYSNELKDLFTDIMHHDLLNPAGVVRGYTEILLDIEENKKKRQYLETIKRNNEKLISIIERASNYAKMASIEDLEFETMDIASLLDGVIETFRPHLMDKNIEVDFAPNGEYCADVNPVIEEVFSNLLCNAIKYSPEGSRIVVNILDAGNEWKVTVTDFGVGISDEDKSLLFKRFRRVKKDAVKGTGLGLAIVKRLITLHGGSVGVEDNPEGQGSRFWVTVRKSVTLNP